MDLTISGEERNTLFNQIADRLTGIDAVYLAVESQDWATAQRAGQEFADFLRFLTEDIGWGEREEKTHALTSPPDLLRRVVRRLHDGALVDRETHERDRDEAGEEAAEAKRLQETCERILGEANTPPGGS